MPRYRKTTEQFIQDAIKVHGDKFDYSEVNYINATTKVKIKCKNNHYFLLRPSDHTNLGIGCAKCSYSNNGKHNKYTINQLFDLLSNKYPDYEFIIDDNYKNISSKIIAKCSKHGQIIKKASSFIVGQICEECSGNKIGKLNKDFFIKQSIKIHDDYYDYSLSTIKSAQIKTKIICPKHGGFLQTPNAHMNGQGCPICNFSKGELAILKWLKSNNINYNHQHKFKDCKNKRELPFDFYLPNYNLCIEYQGEYHFHAYERVGGNNGLKLRQIRDNIKRQYCQENNIKLLEIPYTNIDDVDMILFNQI